LFFIVFEKLNWIVANYYLPVWGTSGSRFKSCRPDQFFQGVMNWPFGVNSKNGVSGTLWQVIVPMTEPAIIHNWNAQSCQKHPVRLRS